MVELPEWKMNDDGTITCSSLKHADALLYTFVETALQHNEKIFSEFVIYNEVQEAAAIDLPSLDELEKEPEIVVAPQKIISLTKADINKILAGMFSPGGVKDWWTLPKRSLGGKTANEVWETNPNEVVKVLNNLLRGVGTIHD